MKNWVNWAIAIALICLLFIAIPISYSGSGNKEKLVKPIFDQYIDKFNKSYKHNPEEYQLRLQHFIANLEEVERLNLQTPGPDQRARYGLTMLSDMSKEEYKEIHLSDEKLTRAPHLYGKSWSKPKVRPRDDVEYSIDDNTVPGARNINIDIHIVARAKRSALPLTVDWRTKGVIGPVRNQGMCGACWAFSTIGTAEAMAAIKTGKLEPLSVQEMIDCAGLGNSGCEGGDICLLLNWLTMTKTTLETDSEYPLRLLDGACRLKKNGTEPGVRISSFTCDEFVGAEDQILRAIATHGPVAVAVNALTWQNYLGGVIQYHCSGAPTDLNHAVELVGYDLTGEIPYYIAKNSWGPEFGNNGYLQLAVGSNMCGLANEVATVDVTTK